MARSELCTKVPGLDATITVDDGWSATVEPWCPWRCASSTARERDIEGTVTCTNLRQLRVDTAESIEEWSFPQAEEGDMLERTASGTALLAGLALALIAGCGPPAGEQGPLAQVSGAPHGAAAMDVQQKELDRLLPDAAQAAVPAGLDAVIWEVYVPPDNQVTPARVALGRKLYFDTRLSADGTVACATCHDVTRGFTDQRPVSEGIGNQEGKRSAPTTMNVALLQTAFWDGRSPSLDHQARQPIVNPVEMGFADGASAVKAIAGDAEYQRLFQDAYGRDVNYEDLGRAIGAFERMLVFIDSPFRRFLLGDANAISAEAKAGWRIFNEEGRCVTCHHMSPSNPLGTDHRFHNVGVSAMHQDFEGLATRALQTLRADSSEQKLDELALTTDLGELGRFIVTKSRADIGAFRTPILLNVGITQPYMHDGTMATLWDVMDHYNKGGEANLYLDGGIEALALTDSQIDQVVAFLFTLTDDRFAEQNRAQMAAQRTKAQAERPFRNTELAARRQIAFEDRIKAK